MDPITYEKLITPDERSEVFGPRVSAEQRLQMMQEGLDRLDLVDGVGPNTKQSFERLRTLYSYGLLCYDLFTVVDDLSFLLLEQALSERFVEYYGGRVTLVHKDGRTDEISAHGFQQVFDALGPGGSHGKGWRLRALPGIDMVFRGSLDHLVSWARRVELLKGQRSRVMERLLVNMRHRVAHSHGYSLTMPGRTSLSDLSAFINQLWGAPTPGSRLYDGPVDRIAMAIGWQNGSLTWLAATELETCSPDTRDFTFIIVQGSARDDGPFWGIRSFDAKFEATMLPTELLWGPGKWSDAVAWVDQQRPGPDHVDYLDRPFMVRVHDGNADVPRRPGVAAAMGEYSGSTWYLVQADFPVDAFVHVRNVAWSAGETPCAAGECPVCAAATLASGELEEVLQVAQLRGIDTAPTTPPDVWIPSLWSIRGQSASGPDS